MKGRTDVGTYVRTLYVLTDVEDIMAIKPNFLTSMGYHIFLSMVLRARAPSARAELRYQDVTQGDNSDISKRKTSRNEKPNFKKNTEGNARKLAVNFRELVTLASQKPEKHAIQALRAILVPSLRAALKL